MSPNIKSLLANVGALGIIIITMLILAHPRWVGFESLQDERRAITEPTGTITPPVQSVSGNSAVSTTTPREDVSKPPVKSAPIVQVSEPELPSLPASENATTSDSFSVTRIPNPYPVPPQTFDIINTETRMALVNILCAPRSGSLRPMSASGIIIDPRGVILTNAHVAQYVLLAGDPSVALSCIIRTGSPAYPTWNAEVLFIPPSWVEAHASDITQARPLGTGEYDYALLRITGNINGQPLPAVLPFVPVDARETIAFTDDSVLAASYPAEFVGGIVTQINLYPVSSITSVKKMLTFSNTFVDVISLGGVIGAQSGSSGGAVINEWGLLVGIISTTSEGATTDARDLHAITLSYINRNIASESGLDLSSILAGDIASEAYDFNTNAAPALRQLLIDQIKSR